MRDGTGRCAKHPKKVWAKRPEAVRRTTGRALQRARAELFARDPLCAVCKSQGLVTLATERDHIVALEDGGLDVVENTQGLCAACHEEKSKRERAAARWNGYRDDR